MVSLRCKMKVEEELNNLGVSFYKVDLGVIEIHEKLKESKRLLLKENLLKSGLVLMDDKRSILIEQIKTTIIELIHNSEELPKINFSDYLAEKLEHDYTYLSNIFSETKGITIQQYMIAHKIEKVKELLLYNELSLSEIAYKMHYSSTAHLSTQFKKITGLTLTYYKQLKLRRSMNLEDL
ncbi:MAG: helix-turn-helix transcriptional regulator [Crocinitomicaceae bacterium]|nr:helix-turn-helix transcriptional regulator [Crocinitomicaceae bacterium]